MCANAWCDSTDMFDSFCLLQLWAVGKTLIVFDIWLILLCLKDIYNNIRGFWLTLSYYLNIQVISSIICDRWIKINIMIAERENTCWDDQILCFISFTMLLCCDDILLRKWTLQFFENFLELLIIWIDYGVCFPLDRLTPTCSTT